MASKYLLTQRPPSIGTHPTDGLTGMEETEFRGRRCYILTYDRSLTEQEVRQYELTVDMESADLIFKSVSKEFAGEKIEEVVTNVVNNVVTTTDDKGNERDYSWLEFQRDYPELFF